MPSVANEPATDRIATIRISPTPKLRPSKAPMNMVATAK